jgi:hypothetical protein
LPCPLSLTCSLLCVRAPSASAACLGLPACLLPSRAQEKLKQLVLAKEAAHKAEGERIAAAERAERERLRVHRRNSVMQAAAASVKPRTSEPFLSPIPPMPGTEPAAAAATPSGKGSAAKPGKGGSAAKPGAKGGKPSALGAPPKNPGKKSSTKMLALQHNRPGEKPKGVKGWMRDLDARGWSVKKTMLSAGLEAWFEAYADAYTMVRLAKQIAPWQWKRNHEEMRSACHWWWTYAKALRDHAKQRGKVASGVVAKIVFWGHAAYLMRRWRKRAAFKKALPAHMRRMPYGKLLQKAVREWRAHLEDTTARRKAGIRRLVEQGAEHYRRKVALPNAWHSWCAIARRHAGAQGTRVSVPICPSLAFPPPPSTLAPAPART